MTGASGLVGTTLTAELRAAGDTVNRFVRPGTDSTHSNSGDVTWDPQTGEMNLPAAEGADAVINLAGASIGGGRWTANRKALLRSSRVDLTEHLVAALARLKSPPKIFISASAIGYYGDRGEESLTEASSSGKDFLSQIYARLGSRRNKSRTIRHAHRPRTLRNHPLKKRRRPTANANPLQTRRRRQTRLRQTMDVLDIPR